MPKVNSKVKTYFVYGLFVILFYFLFVNKLDRVPTGFHIDESLPGYNAYSILKTGKDEWGKTLPIVFRFFRLYNPPLFVYANVVSISTFGLNVFAVRFTSVFFGGVAIAAYYFLLKHSGLIKSKAALFWLVVFFLITPWLVFYSRISFEVVMAFSVFFLGVYFYWMYIKYGKYLAVSYVFMSLSMYVAYTQRFLVPIFLLTSTVVFRNRLIIRKSIRKFAKALFVFGIIQIPYLTIAKTPAFFPKGDMLDLSAFSSQVEKVNALLPITVSKTLVFSREVLSQYFTYFSPRSLFFLPDPDIQRSIPELSVFYPWMVIPYLTGLYIIWKKRSNDFVKLTIILLLTSVIPASFTHDPFATHRAMPMLLPLSLVIALGINDFIKRTHKGVSFSVLSLLFLVSTVLIWRSYFVLFASERAKHWQYGVDKLSDIIKSKPNQMFVIDQARRHPIYTNLAFFMKYPPAKYHQEVPKEVKNDYYSNVRYFDYDGFANIQTRNVNWEIDSKEDKVLVGDEFTFSPEQVAEHKLTKVFEIKDPLGEIMFVGYETQNTESRELR
jgi:4-amino-4-deoxy-L-arabinose transferase-like glycosyltransferase